MRYYVIPNLNELNQYLELSKEYDLGFEYNEFYVPSLLDDSKKLDLVVSTYYNLKRKGDTLHGAFLDIVLDSQDPWIKEASLVRVRSSLDIAKTLGCKGVVFHTNYITWMKDEGYRKRWVEENKNIYLELINEYKDLEIYIENMFDLDPYLLKELIKEINHERVGVCLDVAHASISSVPLDVWFNELGPYIKHLHINDNDKVVDSHQELGMGLIDYDLAFSYINKLDKNVSVLIEIKDYNKTINSINYLKKKGYLE